MRKRTKIIDIEYSQTKVEMGRTYSKNEGQQVDQTLHRVATKEREEIKRRPSRRWQDDITRKEGTTWNRKATGNNGRHWRATSCSGWTKPR